MFENRNFLPIGRIVLHNSVAVSVEAGKARFLFFRFKHEIIMKRNFINHKISEPKRNEWFGNTLIKDCNIGCYCFGEFCIKSIKKLAEKLFSGVIIPN